MNIFYGIRYWAIDSIVLTIILFSQCSADKNYSLSLKDDQLIVSLPKPSLSEIQGSTEKTIDWHNVNLDDVVKCVYDSLKNNAHSDTTHIIISYIETYTDKYGNELENNYDFLIASIPTSEVVKYKDANFFESNYKLKNKFLEAAQIEQPQKDVKIDLRNTESSSISESTSIACENITSNDISGSIQTVSLSDLQPECNTTQAAPRSINYEKENDFLLNVLFNPQFSLSDFILVGLTPHNTVLKDKNYYFGDNKAVNKCSELNITVDEAYSKAKASWDVYLELERRGIDENSIGKYVVTYSPNDIFAPKNIDPEIKHKLSIVPLQLQL